MRPDIIYCSISRLRPDRAEPRQGRVTTSTSWRPPAVSSYSAHWGEQPRRSGVPVADLAASTHAVIAILSRAARTRPRRGRRLPRRGDRRRDDGVRRPRGGPGFAVADEQRLGVYATNDVYAAQRRWAGGGQRGRAAVLRAAARDPRVDAPSWTTPASTTRTAAASTATSSRRAARAGVRAVATAPIGSRTSPRTTCPPSWSARSPRRRARRRPRTRGRRGARRRGAGRVPRAARRRGDGPLPLARPGAQRATGRR